MKADGTRRTYGGEQSRESRVQLSFLEACLSLLCKTKSGGKINLRLCLLLWKIPLRLGRHLRLL
jgi:hypothetical protein